MRALSTTSRKCYLSSTDANDRWKKFTLAYGGSMSLHASMLHWNLPGFWKKKLRYFSNRPHIYIYIPNTRHVQKVSVLSFSWLEGFFFNLLASLPHSLIPPQWDQFKISTLRTVDKTIGFVKNVNPIFHPVQNSRHHPLSRYSGWSS